MVGSGLDRKKKKGIPGNEQALNQAVEGEQ
jgi:hypothetical protein